jgi:hypothetical protein
MRLEHKRKGARVASTLGSKGEQTAPRRLRSEGFGPEQLGEMQKIITRVCCLCSAAAQPRGACQPIWDQPRYVEEIALLCVARYLHLHPLSQDA